MQRLSETAMNRTPWVAVNSPKGVRTRNTLQKSSCGATVSVQRDQTNRVTCCLSGARWFPPLNQTFLFRSPNLVPNVPGSTRSHTQKGTCTTFHATSVILLANAQLVMFTYVDHVDHARFELYKFALFVGESLEWRAPIEHHRLPTQAEPCMLNHNKACCWAFWTQRLLGASWMLFVAACLQKNYSIQTYSFQGILFKQVETSHWKKFKLTYPPPSCMKVAHLMSIRPNMPNMQEARERLKKTRSLCVVCGLLAMFTNRKWLSWDLPVSVRKSTNIDLRVLVTHGLLIKQTRRWNAYWQRQTYLLR